MRADRAEGDGRVWPTPGGIELHAPPGELVRDEETGKVLCHLCGRWFVFLGGHVRVHGFNAASYRELAGLCKTRALAARELSDLVSTRQKAHYATQQVMRDRLAEGQQMARTGELSLLVRQAADPAAIPLERLLGQADQLASGRATVSSRRARALVENVSRMGFDDLGNYLRHAYAAGASLELLARNTGLGRSRLRQALISAEVSLRPQGTNTAAGKRSRAETADHQAAQRVGTPDLACWLRDRRAAGWSLQRLAEAVGRSIPWVQGRLAPDHPWPKSMNSL